MARDADDDYYYDEGTLNEQLEDFGVYEKDGQVHFHYKPNDNVVKVDDLAQVLGAARADPPTTSELDSGEYMIYADDADFQLYVAVNDGGTVKTEAITAFTIANL